MVKTKEVDKTYGSVEKCVECTIHRSHKQLCMVIIQIIFYDFNITEKKSALPLFSFQSIRYLNLDECFFETFLNLSAIRP